MSTQQIVIIDDHQLIAESLALMISRIKGFAVAGTYVSGLDFKKDIEKKGKPDMVILDVNMPEISGIEMAQWLSNTHPDIKILALSMQDNEEDILGMIRAGANGYLLKSVTPAQLELALNTLRDEGVYHSQMVNKVLANSIKNKEPEISISEKEKELLRYLCTDLSYKEIASQMHLSLRTVETYSNKLMEKFEVRGRIGLLLYAQKNGLGE